MAVANEHANALGPQPQMAGCCRDPSEKMCTWSARQYCVTLAWCATGDMPHLPPQFCEDKHGHLEDDSTCLDTQKISSVGTDLSSIILEPVANSDRNRTSHAAPDLQICSERHLPGFESTFVRKQCLRVWSRPELHTSHSRSSSGHPNPRSSSFFTEKPRLS